MNEIFQSLDQCWNQTIVDQTTEKFRNFSKKWLKTILARDQKTSSFDLGIKPFQMTTKDF